MPRRSILTATERENLLGWPESQAELIRHYTLSATDLAIIRLHRGAANRLGYAVQLCSMRFPGVALGVREKPFSPLLQMVAVQLKVPVESWIEYGHRAETRREHALELQAIFGFKPFTIRHYRAGVQSLEDVAWQTDKGIVLVLTFSSISSGRGLSLSKRRTCSAHKRKGGLQPSPVSLQSRSENQLQPVLQLSGRTFSVHAGAGAYAEILFADFPRSTVWTTR
jgi:hypothetical protein